MNEKKSAAELAAKTKPECWLTKDQAETLLAVIEEALGGGDGGASSEAGEPDCWECAEALCLAAQGRTGMALRVLAEDDLCIAAAGNSDLPESELAALRAGLPEWKAREKRERGL